MGSGFAALPLVASFALLGACASSEPTPAKEAGESRRGDPALALLTGLTKPAQEGPYAPRDECGTTGSIGNFRLKLAQAVLDRDADALANLAAPDVLLDFGGGAGRDTLKARLASKEYNLWEALDNLMPLGCAVNAQGGLTMPWYFAQDFGERDTFMTMIVRGQGIPLLAEPRADASIRRTLSWNAVQLDDTTDEESTFAKVDDDASGTPGYVAWDRLRSLIDYRLLVEEREDGWKIAAFVAGD